VFIPLDDLDQYDMVDLTSAGPLRPRALAKAKEEDATFQRLALIAPGLVRNGAAGDVDVVLKKPLILVLIHKPTHHTIKREGDDLLSDREGQRARTR
jgi:hypothetical protein